MRSTFCRWGGVLGSHGGSWLRHVSGGRGGLWVLELMEGGEVLALESLELLS